MQDLIKALLEKYEFLEKANEEYEKTHPSDVPNEVASFAFIKGIIIENSFLPIVGEHNFLCETDYEKIYVWTYKKDTVSALISKTNYKKVKKINCWKTFAHILDLALMFSYGFVGASFEGNETDYKWIYRFDFESTNSDNIEFANMDSFEKMNITSGRQFKLTDISNVANIMDVLYRDDTAYTSTALLYSAFRVNNCCLICELSEHPYHDHLIDEPKIWEQMNSITNLELAVLASCRSVEGILGEPPKREKAGKVQKFKHHFEQLTGINPDDMFKKANMSYMDYYYKLFFELRNPSAHSYGKIHFKIKRKETITAQCFAAIVLKGYIVKHIESQEEALKRFNFNNALLDRVQDNCSIFYTRED